MLASSEIQSQIATLQSSDPVAREVARHALVRIGTFEVTTALVGELLDPRDQVRWEAAKALAELKDPVTAPALLEALDDDHSDVRWVASEGLIALGRPGLLAVLHGLTKKARSVGFCQAAHHVLHEFVRNGYEAANISPALTALEQAEPAVAAPPAAYQALMALKVGKVTRGVAAAGKAGPT